jgi:outer membrane protein assembly factor BamB
MKRPLTILAAACLTTIVQAQDWPRYLGPDGSGKVEGELRSDWKAAPPKELWRKDVGRGCSSFAVVGDKALVMGNKDNHDIVWCLDAKTGVEIWKHRYPEKLDPNLYDGGPNATPTVDGGAVFTLSRSGKLFCLALEDGTVQWQKDLQKDFGGKAPTWGYSASPVVNGGLLYCLPVADDGGLYALDKNNGQVAWRSGDTTRAGYSAPVFFSHNGSAMAAVFHGRELVTYNLDAKGKPMFHFGWRTSYDINASNPQYHDGMMFLASGYGMGYAVVDVTGGKPEILHKDEDLRMIFQNSILVDGDILGVFGDKNLDAEVVRLEMKTGKVRWREKLPGSRGSSLMVGEQMIILLETGDLVLGTPAKDGWTEHGRIKALAPLCWAPVAFGNGRIYARSNKGEAVCIDAN